MDITTNLNRNIHPSPWLAVAVHLPAPHRQGKASEPSLGASRVRGCERAWVHGKQPKKFSHWIVPFILHG